jgi:acetyl esterase/lipase
VEVSRDLAYGPDPAHRADRYRRRGLATPGPVLVQVHGGGWTGGRRNRQGRPLMHRMAAAGWVVFDVAYRLSPRATYPDQLDDVLRAIAWIRTHAADLGADASFVAVTGGSAGAQLAAMAALDGDRPAPGGGDARVQACVPLYGVHDLLDDRGAPKWRYLATHVLKVAPDEDPNAWRRASPVHVASADRPPFLVAHGALDSLVHPEESRRLVAALRGRGGPPVGYAEVPGATHGFDSIHSVRSHRLVDGVEAVLHHLWREHGESRRSR